MTTPRSLRFIGTFVDAVGPVWNHDHVYISHVIFWGERSSLSPKKYKCRPISHCRKWERFSASPRRERPKKSRSRAERAARRRRVRLKRTNLRVKRLSLNRSQ